MIYYSTTDNSREKFYYWIAAISTGLSSILLAFDNKNIHKIMVPSGFVIYGILIYLLDHYIWKLYAFKAIIGIPNLNGKYRGTNIIPKEPNNITEELEVTITQTWRKIDVVVRTNETISSVVAANFNLDNPENKFLKYIWSIKPSKPSQTFNYYGEGATEIRIGNNNNEIVLDGEYFSSKLSSGHFTLRKFN